MQGMSRTLAGVLLLSLAACGGRDQPPAPQPTILPALIPIPNGPLQCVPYARLVSGVAIRGDAWTWWDQAAARYSRGRVAHDVRVIDISPGNDWSELRVWNGAGFGKVYPAHGFIYPGLANAGA
jgi:hypothetical protein